MALTQVGCEVRVRLPRWDHHLVERLEQAGIRCPHAPEALRTAPLEAALIVPADTVSAAREHVMRALRGWTVLLAADFG